MSLSVGVRGLGGLIRGHQSALGRKMNKLLIFNIKTLFTSNVFAEAYSKPYHTSKMKNFVKIVVKYLTVVQKAIINIVKMLSQYFQAVRKWLVIFQSHSLKFFFH